MLSVGVLVIIYGLVPVFHCKFVLSQVVIKSLAVACCLWLNTNDRKHKCFWAAFIRFYFIAALITGFFLKITFPLCEEKESIASVSEKFFESKRNLIVPYRLVLKLRLCGFMSSI